jgi:hypothetical protein
VSILGTKAVAPVFLALLIGGCPKRQTVPRVVYVQPLPASSSAETKQAEGTNPVPKAADASSQAASAKNPTEALVIEEPPPSPPAEPPVTPTSPAVTPVVPAPKGPKHPRAEPHDTDQQSEPAESAAPASPAEVPSLEPRPEPGHNEGTQDEVQAQVDEIKRRITELEKKSDLPSAEQRTLKDANSFCLQSVAALHEHDMLRARELAQKASVLLTALEKR